MGFKCPHCKKDFGLDKSAWANHILKERVDIHTPIKDSFDKALKAIENKEGGTQ